MPLGFVDVRDQQEFSDADFRVVDNADQSKKAKLELSGSATNTQAIVVLEGQQITTVASNTTTNIGAANTTEVSISGTTTITAFDTVQAGIYREGVFQGILTLTHNGTSLILPGAANITTAAGDTFGAVSLGSGNWRVLWYTKASGAAVVASGGPTGMSASAVSNASGATQANVTGLSFAVAASTNYKFDFVLNITLASASARGLGIQFTGPASPTAVGFTVDRYRATGGAGTMISDYGTAFSSIVGSTTGNTNEVLFVHVSGYVFNGSNAGTVQMQFATFASSGTTTVNRGVGTVQTMP